jgi:hypothetical protein
VYSKSCLITLHNLCLHKRKLLCNGDFLYIYVCFQCFKNKVEVKLSLYRSLKRKGDGQGVGGKAPLIFIHGTACERPASQLSRFIPGQQNKSRSPLSRKPREKWVGCGKFWRTEKFPCPAENKISNRPILNLVTRSSSSSSSSSDCGGGRIRTSINTGVISFIAL